MGDIPRANLVIFTTGQSIPSYIKAPIGYETGESPYHMAKFPEDAKSKVRFFARCVQNFHFDEPNMAVTVTPA